MAADCEQIPPDAPIIIKHQRNSPESVFGLSFSGLLAVCQSQGWFSGRRDPPDPRGAEAIRTNQLVGLGLKS